MEPPDWLAVVRGCGLTTCPERQKKNSHEDYRNYFFVHADFQCVYLDSTLVLQNMAAQS